MIYFDNAATTYPKPQCVYDAINEGMHKYSFNVGRSGYRESTETFKMVEQTRKLIADMAQTDSHNIIFTSSATESLNMIIGGLKLSQNDYVYVSPFEHNAVVRTLALYGAKVEIIPFDKSTWEVNLDELNDMFALKKPKAVILSQISNVTGYLLPYISIFKLSKKFNSINVLDSAQAFGVYGAENDNVDYLVFAGHKSLYAMFGIAGFVKYTTLPLAIMKAGGTGSDSLNEKMPEQTPQKYEAGSLNSVGIYSINASIKFLRNNSFAKIEYDLVKYFLDRIKEIKEVKVFLPDGYVPYGIVSIAIEGFSSEDIGTILAEDYDICVRTGYHCAPYIHDFIGSKIYGGTIRFSFGGFNTKEEIDTLINALKEVVL